MDNLAHDASASWGLRVLGEVSSDFSSAHPSYHLPHHKVLQQDSSTTKIRVVFNGSSPTLSGKLINDMHPGANLYYSTCWTCSSRFATIISPSPQVSLKYTDKFKCIRRMGTCNASCGSMISSTRFPSFSPRSSIARRRLLLWPSDFS